MVAETNGMGRLDWKKAEIIPVVFGLMTGRLFASKMYPLFGKRATDYDLIIPLDIHITITDKDKNKIHMKIQESQYNLKDGLEFKLRKFNHAKVIEKKLVEK